MGVFHYSLRTSERYKVRLATSQSTVEKHTAVRASEIPKPAPQNTNVPDGRLFCEPVCAYKVTVRLKNLEIFQKPGGWCNRLRKAMESNRKKPVPNGFLPRVLNSIRPPEEVVSRKIGQASLSEIYADEQSKTNPLDLAVHSVLVPFDRTNLAVD